MGWSEPKMATTVVFLLPLFIFPVLRCEDSNASLKSVIDAIEMLISYYKNNYMEFNVDGLFGLRAVEGHINLLLKEYEDHQHQHLENDTVFKLRKIATEAALVGNLALKFVKKDNEPYYNNFKFVIHSPWDLFKRHREIDPNYKWDSKWYKANKEGYLDEETSDACMGELMGDRQTNRKPCMISDKCLQVMTLKGRTGYGITHQVLWTMLAEKAGCLPELNQLLLRKGYSSVAEMQLEFCTNNYYEMVAVVHIYMKGNITTDYQDLFLEQQFVCPSLGFYEYLKKTYLTQILSWQKKSGCFSDSKFSSLQQLPKAKNSPLKKSVIKYKENHDDAFVHRPPNVQSDRKQNVFQANQNHNMNNPPKQGLNVVDSFKKQNVINMVQNHKLKVNNIPPLNHDPIGNNVRNQNMIRLNQNHKFIANNNLPMKHGLNIDDLMENQNYKVNVRNDPSVNVNQGQNVNHHVGKHLPFGGVKDIKGKSQQNAPRDMFHFKQQDYLSQKRHGRRLLVEKSLADGCLAHKTAVAAGALVMYLRYLIDPGALNLTSTHLILPESSRSLLAEARLQDFQNQKVKGEGLIPVRQELGEELVLNQGEDHEAMEDGEEEAGGNAEEQTDEEEEEEELDEADDNYKDDDEMYPEKPENPEMQDRKVVRFGNGNKADVEFEKNRFEDDGDADVQDHYVDGDNAQDNQFQADLRGGNHDQQEDKDEEEYTYYDPPDKEMNKDVDFEKRDVKPPVHRNVHRSKKKVNFDDTQQIVYGSNSVVIKSKPQDRTLFIVFASSSLVIIFLMYRFIKKRRIHLRYMPRKLFKL